MRFAYADPPYLGLAVRFYGDLHPEAAVYDTVDGHAALIGRLNDEFPDGWAMSLHSPSLRTILPLCPDDVRVAAWVKPFASFKPGVAVAYTWEPVIFRGGRNRGREALTVRDFTECEPDAVKCNITLRRGFQGAKPEKVCHWIFSMLGAEATDEMVDVFPGSGSVTRAWATYTQSPLFPLDNDAPLFAEGA